MIHFSISDANTTLDKCNLNRTISIKMITFVNFASLALICYIKEMYDFPPYRPPSEAYSVLIRVTHGCNWNHCTFCGMYKETPSRHRDIECIKSDIAAAPAIFPRGETIFLADSDPLTHPDIQEVLDEITRSFPDAQRITTYARASTLARMGSNQLSQLKQIGLSRIHVGLESGDVSILKRIKKGCTPTLITRAAQHAKSAGLELCFYVLSGIGGDQKWQSHAKETARVLNQTGADFIRLRTLTLVANAPLYTTWTDGQFTPVSPLNRLRETEFLIRELTLEGCRLESDHITNNLWAPEGLIYHGVAGCLPEDKPALLDLLVETIGKVKDRQDIVDANTLFQQGLIGNL
jgi:hypothetical protein